MLAEMQGTLLGNEDVQKKLKELGKHMPQDMQKNMDKENVNVKRLIVNEQADSRGLWRIPATSSQGKSVK